MKILIIGAGDVGFHLAFQLSSEEAHEVVVIELNPERAQRIQDAMDAQVIEGNGASLGVLERAGITGCDLVLAVTSSDEVNLMACLAASQYRVPVKIARVSKSDYYHEGGVLTPERLGVDLMINPERECAAETHELLQSAAITESIHFEGGLVQLVGMVVREGAPIAGKTLMQLGAGGVRSRFLMVALVRGGRTVIPSGQDRVEPGDQIFVIGEPSRIPELLPLAGYSGFKLRRVMVAGGSREAWFLARMLEEHQVECTILERDRRRALELAEGLDHCLVLHGDATDLDLLEMEAAGEADAFVAYTGSDETNLLSCLLAKNLGAPKVVSLVDRSDYIPLVTRVGVDAAVSPRRSTVNAILRYVRGGTVLAVATLRGSEAEGIEFRVSDSFPHAGKRLAEVTFPKGSLAGAIIRQGRVIIPRGGDAIRVGDRVVMFVLPGALPEVEELFAK
ncbi:MAG: Trk system potassium transporter TrkA [Longimicrobiaceae bacterium]